MNKKQLILRQRKLYNQLNKVDKILLRTLFFEILNEAQEETDRNKYEEMSNLLKEISYLIEQSDITQNYFSPQN